MCRVNDAAGHPVAHQPSHELWFAFAAITPVYQMKVFCFPGIYIAYFSAVCFLLNGQQRKCS